MLKSAIIVAKIGFVFAIVLFTTGSISVKQNLPDFLNPGDSDTVEVIIEKGSISGPAQLRILFPDGLSVTKLDNEGGVFSFEDQRMLINWKSIPEAEQITVKYLLHADEHTLGKKTITGRFSYIESIDGVSTRQKYNLEPVRINIGTENLTSSKSEETEQLSIKKDDITAVRTVVKTNDSTIKVSIKINTGGVQGFAKLVENFNPAFKAQEISSAMGNFKYSNGKVKILWAALPEIPKFEISYLITVPEGNSGEFSIVGDFDPGILTENDQRISIEITESKFIINPKEDFEKTPEIAKVEETRVGDSFTKSDKIDIKKPKGDNNGIGQISFKVQVCALKKKRKERSFKKRYKFKGSISTERHEGWYKYTVGEYTNYKKARDKRESLNSNYKFPGPFVSAYNSGKRITVQEGLMVANQKWVK